MRRLRGATSSAYSLAGPEFLSGSVAQVRGRRNGIEPGRRGKASRVAGRRMRGYRVPRVPGTRYSAPVRRAQRRQPDSCPRLLALLPAGGGRPADVRARGVDGTAVVAVEEAARLQKRQREESVGPFGRAQPRLDAAALGADTPLAVGVGLGGEDGEGAATGAAAVALERRHGLPV